MITVESYADQLRQNVSLLEGLLLSKRTKKWNNHVLEKRETQADTQIYSNRSFFCLFVLRAYYVPALIKPQACTNSSDPPYNAVRWVLLLLFG